VIGTVGLLLRAKRRGHVQAVKPLLDRLQGSGFWMSEALCNRALDLADEG
jgi:predicted nucleic acid-binding protein